MKKIARETPRREPLKSGARVKCLTRFPIYAPLKVTTYNKLTGVRETFTVWVMKVYKPIRGLRAVVSKAQQMMGDIGSCAWIHGRNAIYAAILRPHQVLRTENSTSSLDYVLWPQYSRQLRLSVIICGFFINLAFVWLVLLCSLTKAESFYQWWYFTNPLSRAWLSS